MQVTFTYAELRDLPKIVLTYNSSIPSRMATADLEPVTVASKQNWFEAHSPEKRPLWLVKVDDNYAGWMSFNSFYGRPAYDGTVEISIYLEEKFKGRGIGKKCLEKAIQEAPKLNIHTLLGFIFGHNLASIKLFENFGFKVWGEFPRIAAMDGEMRDLHILGLKTNHPLNVNS